jgi:hypothetical protein
MLVKLSSIHANVLLPCYLLFQKDNILAMSTLPHQLWSFGLRCSNTAGCAEVATEEAAERFHMLWAPNLNFSGLEDSMLFADPVSLQLIMARANFDSANFGLRETTRMLPKLLSRSIASSLRALSAHVDAMFGDHFIFCSDVIQVWLESAVVTDWMRIESQVRMVFFTWVGGHVVTEGASVSVLHAYMM